MESRYPPSSGRASRLRRCRRTHANQQWQPALEQPPVRSSRQTHSPKALSQPDPCFYTLCPCTENFKKELNSVIRKRAVFSTTWNHTDQIVTASSLLENGWGKQGIWVIHKATPLWGCEPVIQCHLQMHWSYLAISLLRCLFYFPSLALKTRAKGGKHPRGQSWKLYSPLNLLPVGIQYNRVSQNKNWIISAWFCLSYISIWISIQLVKYLKNANNVFLVIYLLHTFSSIFDFIYWMHTTSRD